MKAPELLKQAAQHMQDRAATYDKPEGERSMGRAVTAFNAITGQDLTEQQGWLLMQVLKDVRLFTNQAVPHQDSIEDCIAYAALKGEAFGCRNSDSGSPDAPAAELPLQPTRTVKTTITESIRRLEDAIALRYDIDGFETLEQAQGAARYWGGILRANTEIDVHLGGAA